MRPSLALLAVLAPAALLPPGPAAAEARLVYGTKTNAVEIPFELFGNHIYVRGRVNDSDSLWIVLDTGASGASISASKAKALGLKVERGGQSNGAGGVVESGRVRSTTLRMPGLEFKDLPLSTLPLDAIELQSGRAMDVILGYALLSRAVVEIDYAASVLRITDPAKFTPPADATELALTFKQNLPYIEASVEVPGRDAISGEFVLDAGASTALTFAPDVVEREKLVEALPRTLRMRAGGVGGQVDTRVGRTDRLRIGPYALEQPVTMFRQPGPGGISAQGTAGNIGCEVLRRFDVTFDYAQKRMWLLPNDAIHEPFEVDMTGLVTQVVADSTRGRQVLWVQDDSPAKEAGVAAGDVIVAIDGRPVSELSPPALRDLFRVPDHTYQLSLRRGSTRLEVKLTTRRLI